jgi:hypothetical protein
MFWCICHTTNLPFETIPSSPKVCWFPPLLLLCLMVLHHQYFLFLLTHLRFLVLEWGQKVHIEMMVWPFPFEISYACLTFHFSHTFYRPFQYLFRLYPTLHPTTNLHPFPPLLMPWVLLEAKYTASWVHYFFMKTLS